MSDLNVRKTYTPRLLACGMDSVTPAMEIESGIDAIVAAWNRLIPRNRVRFITQARRDALVRALGEFTAAQVLAALEQYGKSAWNRQKGVWKTFDAWIEIEYLTRRIEMSIEVGERAEVVKQAETDRQASEAKVRQQAAQAEQDRKRRFEALPDEKKKELLAKGAACLSRLHLHVTGQAIAGQAMKLMEK